MLYLRNSSPQMWKFMQGTTAPPPPSWSLSLRRISALEQGSWTSANRPHGVKDQNTKSLIVRCTLALTLPDLPLRRPGRLPSHHGTSAPSWGSPFHHVNSWYCSAGLFSSWGRRCLMEVLLLRRLARLHLSPTSTLEWCLALSMAVYSNIYVPGIAPHIYIA